MRIPVLLLIGSLWAHASARPDLQAFPPSPAGRLLLTDGKALDLNDLITTIRSQIKEAVQELTSQAAAYALKHVEHYRVEVLKKLGPVTLGAVFRWIFDGIPGLLEDTPSWNHESQHHNTDKYGSGVDLVTLLTHKDQSDLVKDEYSYDVESEDDDDDEDVPNDVRPDYTIMDLFQ